jgi:hypothetical protein
MYIVASRGPDGVNGMMAMSIENDARTLMNIRSSPVFSVILLATDSIEKTVKIAQPYYGSKIEGRVPPSSAEIHRKLQDVPYHLGEASCPHPGRRLDLLRMRRGDDAASR